MPAGGATSRPTAGRKKTPHLLKTLVGLLREDNAGDPTGRRSVWTGKRLGQITRELRRLGIAVSPNTVRRLLNELGYALHSNAKSLATSQPLRTSSLNVSPGRKSTLRAAPCPCGAMFASVIRLFRLATLYLFLIPLIAMQGRPDDLETIKNLVRIKPHSNHSNRLLAQ